MKIAVVTDNGTTISNHFGRAHHYMVMTAENGAVVAKEMRDKQKCQGHGHAHGHRHDHDHERCHGHGHDHEQSHSTQHDHADTAQESATTAVDTHRDAVSIIDDCEIVIARGMGHGMHQRLQAANIRPVLTRIAVIDTAVTAYLEGRLKEHPELIH